MIPKHPSPREFEAIQADRFNKAIEGEKLKYLYPSQRNYMKVGDYVKTNNGKILRIISLDFKSVFTNKGEIKKRDILFILE
jgi:hypothetical protein